MYHTSEAADIDRRVIKAFTNHPADNGAKKCVRVCMDSR